MGLTIVLGIIVAVLLYLLIVKNKKAQNNSRVLPDELKRTRNVNPGNEKVAQDYSYKIDDLNHEVQSKKQTIQELNNSLHALKGKEESFLRTISELNRDIETLKNDNERLNGILMNQRNSIPTVLKLRKDHSDLLFFYRELIHTIVYYNPVHVSITDFSDAVSLIDKELKKKEVANEFGECLDRIDFSNLEDQIRNFEARVVSLLYNPFRTIQEGEFSMPDAKKQEQFQQNISARINKIVGTRRADLKRIEKLYQLLNDNYERWRKILSRSWFENLIRVTWDGLKKGIIDRESETVLGNLMRAWEDGENLNDNDFVELYSNTVQSLINASVDFSKNLDLDFTALEIVYQKYQEKENSMLHEQVQRLLIDGEDISALYQNWRKVQVNPSLREYPNLLELVFDDLRAKSLDEHSIENIKGLVTNTYLPEAGEN